MSRIADAANVRAELETFLDGINVREPIRPGEITVDDFAGRRAIDYTAARQALMKQVRAGKMTKRPATRDGHPCIAYSLVRK